MREPKKGCINEEELSKAIFIMLWKAHIGFEIFGKKVHKIHMPMQQS